MNIDEEEKTYEVLYLDHGDRAVVEMHAVKPLPSHFVNRPFLAIECSLAYQHPVEGKWSDSSADFLWDATGPHKTCMAKVSLTIFEKNGNKSNVHLEKKIFCSREIVEENVLHYIPLSW